MRSHEETEEIVLGTAMTKLGDPPAFPSEGEGFGDPKHSAPGLTIRQEFAARATSALLSRPMPWSIEDIVSYAVQTVDALIAELEKK